MGNRQLGISSLGLLTSGLSAARLRLRAMLAAVDWAAVSAIASAVAAVAAAAAAKASWKSLDHAQKASQRSQLVGSFVKDKDSTWLQIDCLGPSIARDVRLTIDPIPLRLEPENLPDILAPGQRVALTYRHIPDAPRSNAELHWTDDTGQNQSITIPPSLLPLSGQSLAARGKEMEHLRHFLSGS